MANYELVNADQLDSDLTSVGNAIRSKSGTSAKLSFPSGMVSAIGAISTGVELNFDVVGGTTAPSNPKENMIWVNTSTKITSYIFSATQPTGSAGMVWISTDTYSSAEFNALKKNGIQVYPISAKQYVSGAWVEKIAKIRQSGAWVPLGFHIVTDGVLTPIGLDGRMRINSGFNVVQNDGYVRIYTNGTTSDGFTPSEKINVSNKKQIVLRCNIVNAGVAEGVGVGWASALNAHDYAGMFANIVARTQAVGTGEQTITCDVPASGDFYYPCIYADAGTSGKPDIYVYDFYVE